MDNHTQPTPSVRTLPDVEIDLLANHRAAQYRLMAKHNNEYVALLKEQKAEHDALLASLAGASAASAK
jgi:hypothetical protein